MSVNPADAEAFYGDVPSLGRRISRALMLLVMFPVAGIPTMVGLLIESAFLAWLAADVALMGDFNTITVWLFCVQLAVILLFVVPGIVVGMISILRTGELPE